MHHHRISLGLMDARTRDRAPASPPGRPHQAVALFAVAVLCALLVGACGAGASGTADVSCASPPPAPPALGPEARLTGRIAWASNRAGGNMDLYAMAADGTGVRRLTTTPATEIAPVWSPDGARIAFLSFEEGFESVDADVSPKSVKRPTGRRGRRTASACSSRRQARRVRSCG
jgi:hypothetical protein